MEGHLYLPGELLLNILTRVPSESLLRCTSVCKSWHNLITSPHFIAAHLLATHNNPRNQLLVYGADKYSIHRDDEEFSKLSEFDSPFDAETRIVNSYNGLVCLHTENHSLYLWNPCIRKILKIPPTEDWDVVGFGFSAESNDYKIVTMYKHYRDPEARVYELRTGSWKIIQKSKQFLQHYNVRGYSDVLLNDKIYWVGSNRRSATMAAKVMIALDLKKDEFGVLNMPPDTAISPISLRLTLFSSGCLALIQTHFAARGSIEWCIWLMDGGDGCWTKKFAAFLPEAFRVVPVVFMQNGDALIARGRRIDFTAIIDFVTYDLKTQKTRIQILSITPSNQFRSRHVNSGIKRSYLFTKLYRNDLSDK